MFVFYYILGKTPEDFYNGSSQSRVVLAKPRLGGFGTSTFASSSTKNCNPFGNYLFFIIPVTISIYNSGENIQCTKYYYIKLFLIVNFCYD